MLTLIIFLASVVAFSLSALTGGGASILLIPLLSCVLPILEVPAALVVGTAASSLSRAFCLWSSIRWDIVRIFLPAALPATIIGVLTLQVVDSLLIEWLMGIFLLSNIRMVIFPSRPMTTSQKNIRLRIFLNGLGAGFVSGATGAIGLLMNRFYSSQSLTKDEIVATRAANEILLHLLKLFLYFHLGLFTIKAFHLGLFIAVAATLSSFGITQLLAHLSETGFRRLGYVAMVASGIVIFYQSSEQILVERNPSVSIVPTFEGFETFLSWGIQRTALEFEEDGSLSLERTLRTEELPDCIRSKLDRLQQPHSTVICEEVFSNEGHYFEVYLTSPHSTQKFEFDVENC